MKKIFLLIVYSCSFHFANGQNLVDTSEWIVGANVENFAHFNTYGGAQHNVIENGTDPYGNTSPLWKIFSGTEQYPLMATEYFYDPADMDKNKTYRFTIWVKQSNPFNAGIGIYMQTNTDAVVDPQGNLERNVYIKSSGQLQASEKWYLCVLFVKGQNDTNTYVGGIYDGQNGQLVANAVNDGRTFNNTLYQFKFQVFTYGSTDPSDNLFLFDPRIEEVTNGDDSVVDLLTATPPLVDCASSPLVAEYNINNTWSSGQSSITVNEGDNLIFSGLPNSLTVNVTDPSGQIHPDNHQIQSVSLSDAGTYTITDTTTDCSQSLQLVVNDPTGNGNPSANDTMWTKSSTNVALASATDNLAIGRSSVPNGYKLAIEGHIRARELRVDQDNWPDYVFNDTYQLPTLNKIQQHINEKGHLPNIPSAKEVEANGIEIGEMNRLLLEKIEELTLYLLHQNQTIEQLTKRIQTLENKNTDGKK